MSNIKTFYVRNSLKNRDLTIVSDLIEIDGRKIVKCGWAFRSNHDQFKKKEGRAIAQHRMNVNDERYTCIFEVETPKFRDISSKILENIIANKNTPKKYIQDIEWDYNYFSGGFY